MCAYWHVKKRVRIEKSNFEGGKIYQIFRNPTWVGFNDYSAQVPAAFVGFND
jgi:hypothetical protein